MNKIPINKNAGFLIRLLALFIDIVIFCAIGITASLMCMTKNKINFSMIFKINDMTYTANPYNFSMYQIKNDYTYYFWLILLLCILSIQFILIPLLAKGRTLGMIICRLDLKSKSQSLEKSLIKRIELGVLLWMLIIVLFMAMVNTKIVNKISIKTYLNNNKYEIDKFIKSFLPENFKINKFEYQIYNLDAKSWCYSPTSVETFLYAFPSAISPIVVLVQLFLLISIGFKKEKVGLVDRFSETRVVYHKKFNYIEVKQMIVISPEKNIKQEIIWK